jgi:hypothetical protein
MKIMIFYFNNKNTIKFLEIYEFITVKDYIARILNIGSLEKEMKNT